MQSLIFNKSSQWLHFGLNCCAAFVLVWCGWQCISMSENRFLDLLDKLHSSGIAIAYFDGISMLIALLLLLKDLKTRCRASALMGGAIFFVVVVLANMLDFYTTIVQSPDVSLETNTIWNSIREIYGLQLALLFGFWGKFFLSVLAAVCFSFYLNNVEYLFASADSSPLWLPLNIGSVSRVKRQRMRALCCVFAFYFATINLFCFYIAYANSLVTDLPTLSKLPALPAAIVMSLLAITIAFLATTYIAQRRLRAPKSSCRHPV